MDYAPPSSALVHCRAYSVNAAKQTTLCSAHFLLPNEWISTLWQHCYRGRVKWFKYGTYGSLTCPECPSTMKVLLSRVMSFSETNKELIVPLSRLVRKWWCIVIDDMFQMLQYALDSLVGAGRKQEKISKILWCWFSGKMWNIPPLGRHLGGIGLCDILCWCSV